MERTLQLIFRNEDGRLFTLSVPGPKEDLTETDIAGVMDLILAKNIFQTTGGALTTKVRARIVSRDTVEIAAFE